MPPRFIDDEARRKLLEELERQGVPVPGASGIEPSLAVRALPDIGEPPPQPVRMGPTYNPPGEVDPGMMTATTVQPTQPTYNPQPVTPGPTGPTFNYNPETTPIPVYDDKGRPTGVEGGGDPLQQREAYLRAQQEYKPQNNNSRLKSFLIGLGRGYLRGGGLIGAATEGIRHAIDPSADEEFHRQREISRTTQEIGGEYGRRKVASDLQSEAVDRDYKRAQTKKMGEGPQYAPELKVDANGILNRVDKMTGKSTPVLDADGQPFKAKEGAIYYEYAGVRYEQLPGQAPRAILDSRVKEDGLMVTPGQALSYRGQKASRQATEENRQYQRGRDVEGDERHDRERMETRKAAAAGILQAMEASNAEAAKWQGLAAGEKVETQKVYYTSLAETAKREAVAKAKQLSEAYGDLYEAGEGEEGWAYAKAKPQPEPTRARGGQRYKVDPRFLQ